MTSREKSLVILLVVVAAVVGVGLASLSVWDSIERSNVEYATLGRKVTQWQTQTLANPVASPRRSTARLEALLWAPGKAPGILDFSRSVQVAAGASGLVIQSFRVVDQDEGRGWVQVQGRGPIEPWLSFVHRLSSSDSPILFRNVVVKRGDGEEYTYSCEVGYASLP